MFDTFGTGGMSGNIKNIWCKVDDERPRGKVPTAGLRPVRK